MMSPNSATAVAGTLVAMQFLRSRGRPPRTAISDETGTPVLLQPNAARICAGFLCFSGRTKTRALEREAVAQPGRPEHVELRLVEAVAVELVDVRGALSEEAETIAGEAVLNPHSALAREPGRSVRCEVVLV